VDRSAVPDGACPVRAVVFLLTVVLVATMVVLAVHKRPPDPFAGLPVATASQLRTMPLGWDRLLGRRYDGWFPGVGEVRDNVFVARAEDRLLIDLSMGAGEGSVGFVGHTPDSAGAFAARTGGSNRYFPLFKRIAGRLHGPALVNGVPMLYVDIRSVAPRDAKDPRATREWVGYLRGTPP
jgi:hypothetical protein